MAREKSLFRFENMWLKTDGLLIVFILGGIKFCVCQKVKGFERRYHLVEPFGVWPCWLQKDTIIRRFKIFKCQGKGVWPL